MALIILQPNATSSLNLGSGSDTDTVFGTGAGSETVRIDGDGQVQLDPSFNAGGDTIQIDGFASDYSATVSGSNLVLTNGTGASISIPVGGVGATVEFLDASRTLVIKDGELCLGDQVFPTDGSTVVLDDGDANQAPVFSGGEEVDISLDEGTVFSDSLLATDPDGDDLTFALQTGALNGTVVVNADGTYTYTPNAGFSGSDQYVVTVSDGELTDTLVVNVTVNDTGGGSGGTGDTLSLTVGQDTIVGTDGDDTIRARVSQNQLGSQANALGSGDFIDGGAGIDTLDAWVQDASALGAGPGSSILPETTSVEIAHFRALSVATQLGDLNLDDLPTLFGDLIELVDGGFCDASGPRIGVEINASDMFGLTEVGSVRSDDSLTIYNLTTLASDGETARNTSEVMVRMDHTGNDNAIDPESDLTVLFDRDYLLCDEDGVNGAQMRIQILDIDAAILRDNGIFEYPEVPTDLYQSEGPIDGDLDEIPYTALEFVLGGTSFVLDFSDPANGGRNPQTHEALLALLKAAIAADDRLNGNLVDEGFYDVTVDFGQQFTVDDADGIPGGIVSAPEIVFVNATDTAFPQSADEFESIDFDATLQVPGDKDFQLQPFFGPPDEPVDCKIEVDVKLEKVGRGGDGGELTIGGMTPDLDNNLDEESQSGVPELPRGVEQFNVQVLGRADQPSSLAALRSTDNTLQVIIIADEGTSDATLTIGNRNTTAADGFDASFGFGFRFDDDNCDAPCDVSSVKNNALKDVLIFDASRFDNDTEVHGHFSDETVAKYLDLVDTDSDATADDVSAMYTFGAGDNILNMNISQTNMAVQGSITRGDFSFFTDTGAGDDTVLIQLGDGEAELDDDFSDAGNWYTNHLLNDNLTIRTGEGDDYINTWGASAARINAGDGADVIFTDNSGGAFGFEDGFNCGRATWVFNARNDDVNDLESQSVVSLTNAANLRVVVQYMDFIVSVNLADTVGSINGVTITDMTIVQAIKQAINDHPVLSDFLVAEDGPGRSLVVRSLVDGENEVTDLTVSLASSGPLSADQLAGTAETLGDFTAGELAAFGFSPTGRPLNDFDPDAIDDADPDEDDHFHSSVAPGTTGRWDSDFGYDRGKELRGEDSTNINNNRVEGGLGNDEIALSSSDNSIEHIIISGVFSSLDEPGFGDHILNFKAGQEVEISDDVAEVQTIDFDVVDIDDGTIPDETLQDALVTVTVNGTDYEVLIPAGSTADETAALVAAEISADPAVASATASMDDSGVVTITYVTGTNYPEVTTTITSPDPTEEQTVTITGAQTDAENVTINFAGETFVIPILAGSTVGQIEQQIVTFIQNNSSALVTATIDNDTDVDDAGDADATDGVFTLQYFGGTDQPLATTSVSTNNPGANTSLAVSQQMGDDFAPFDAGLSSTEDTLVEGVPAGTAVGDYDIFDLTGIIGAGGPGYFENQAITFGDGFGAGEDDVAEGTTSEEYAVINRLVDSGANGVVLVDTVDGDSTISELAELQALVTAADNTAHAGGGSNTSVIITVSDTPRADDILSASGDDGDDDGVFGDFYQVVDGAGVGDATVTYLGRVYLGGSDLTGKEDIGDFEALTAANFTPLTPTEIIDSIGAII